MNRSVAAILVCMVCAMVGGILWVPLYWTTNGMLWCESRHAEALVVWEFERQLAENQLAGEVEFLKRTIDGLEQAPTHSAETEEELDDLRAQLREEEAWCTRLVSAPRPAPPSLSARWQELSWGWVWESGSTQAWGAMRRERLVYWSLPLAVEGLVVAIGGALLTWVVRRRRRVRSAAV